MTERINMLAKLTLAGEMYVDTVRTEWECVDGTSRIEDETMHLCSYILNQEPKLTPYSAMTGRFNFDGSVVGDAFGRSGHVYTQRALERYYLKPQENLSTMEWQHATADYKKVLEKGISGIIGEIDNSLENHKDPEKIEFLKGLKRVAEALIEWQEKCRVRVLDFVSGVEGASDKARLLKTSRGAFTRQFYLFTYALVPTPIA